MNKFFDPDKFPFSLNSKEDKEIFFLISKLAVQLTNSIAVKIEIDK